MKPRYAQENHTHVGLDAGASGGHITAIAAAPGTASLGALCSPVQTSGTAASQTITPTSASPLLTRPRVRFTTSTSVAYVTTSTATTGNFLSANRGFALNVQFGFGSLVANSRAFVGLAGAAASAYTLTSGWATYGTLGFGVVAEGGAFAWAWSDGAAGTGATSACAVTLASDNLYNLLVESDDASTVGTLTNIDTAESEQYTFTTLPAGGLRPWVSLRGDSTAYLYFCREDTYEDLVSPFGV